ncbi:MAG: hypothetical protein ACKERG_03430 [Candidatus Hodgkinia cicadicola]
MQNEQVRRTGSWEGRGAERKSEFRLELNTGVESLKIVPSACLKRD